LAKTFLVDGTVQHRIIRPFVAVLLMGFFGALFGCSNGNGDRSKNYVSEGAFRENLVKQTKMSPQTVAQLRKYGVTDDTDLKLEFFFYTDKEPNAQGLSKALQALDYKVEYRPAAADSHLLLVTGWTIPIKMTDESVVAWADRMCRLGYEHDCEFDGWGTNPN
jgi:hypothetical protein